ncbi:MAG: NAD(P)-dependent oxidoreductase [Melioribacteraceae bacterium]|nr:MAG: NAD(P)-dependent oxidoreductase [Melioribacteraceae bacterium]
MRILITGGSGLLGQYVNEQIAKEHDLLTLYNSVPANTRLFNSASVDITNFAKLEILFEQFNPDVVIHLAAVASVKEAHGGNKNLIYNINVNTTENIARLCERYRAKMIYTSTDLVYAGYRGKFLKEESKKDPRSLYAETKLIGEEKIKSVFNNYIILRTALLFGFGKNGRTNFFFNTYQKFLQIESVKLFYDQYRTPLELSDAARIISELIRTDVAGITMNFGGVERLSRVEMAEILCEEANLSKSSIDSVSMHDLPGMPDVQDVSLDISLMESLGLSPRMFRDSVRTMINSYQNT